MSGKNTIILSSVFKYVDDAEKCMARIDK